MDTRTQTSESQHSYPPSPWSTATPKTPNGLTAHTPDGSQDAAAAAAAASSLQFPSHLELLPFLFPQQSIYHAQLLHYNKLISPARGGGLHKASLRDTATTKGTTAGGHGSRSHQASDKNRTVITAKEVPPKMPAKQVLDLSRNLPHRSIAASTSPHGQAHSSSVPSTPHQHARQFSFESREPSPTNGNNHSPRSAYSETNSTLPSLRPLPPRLGGCKYETAQINSRRRIPYSVGNDRLEKLELRTVKSKLSENEEKKLASDMREVYDRLLPTDKVEENRKKLVQKLEKIFNDEWPGHEIRVHLFGSSGNLLCSDDSDVDICITTSWHELEQVCIIADLLARRGMEKVVCISAAKVPIVKIWDPELGLACDMNVNNTLALENTRMVRTYVETDPRIRQLAMIIKYWTRRRIVNDAAFGGTLSSYTWICLIIAFLQLRTPAILPSLHQLPHKTTKPDGTVSDFADNLKKLKGYGNKNKSSEAELLFQFFRFYAHEFDYDKHVLSVRQGKMVTKIDKKWNYAINNQLCVEEPFNTSRNLGNTADEYSFRGLHLELRRAFDLISAAKFEEACEQYVFPKEEERVWSRPAPQSRPVLLRSSSQSHSGRGGRGNHRGRHNNNYRHGGGSNRRASSSVATYDPNVYAQPMNMQQDMSWYQNQQLQFQYTQQDIINQMAMQENMRQLHLYAQSPAFLQHQGMNQQRLSANAGSAQQSADRSRTNSFDNAPITAAFRPDLYTVYGMGMGHFYPQATGYGTYPSSPVTTNGVGQEFRRPLQRSTATSDAGVSTSSGSLRSQSQPASRSPSAAHARAAYTPGSQGTPGFGPRHVHGIPIPSFISDDADYDETPKGTSDSPQSEESKSNGYFPARGSSPAAQSSQQLQSPAANGIAFGDIANQKQNQNQNQASSPGRRRLSTDQLPQTILDRRMRRTSRSPSPLGHARAFSVGTSSAPLSSAPFPGSQNRNLTRPLVVNGSGLKTSIMAGARQPPRTESMATEDYTASSIDNPLHINTPPPSNGGYTVETPVNQMLTPGPPLPSMADHSPVIVNGSNASLAPPPADDASFRERIAMMNLYHVNPHSISQESQYGNGSARLSPSARQRLMSRQPQSGVIAPLDLAISDHRVGKSMVPEMAHLSPVYETQVPSPTAFRKQDSFGTFSDKLDAQVNAKAARGETAKATAKPQEAQKPQEGQKSSKAQRQSGQTPKGNTPRENGHNRSVKSEVDGSWQKAGKGKKKGVNVTGQSTQAEQLPKHDSERKGG
ncbi:Poly(A) RNA polymerase cid13 [Cladobotryum mycophilum]|uniref:polynucleotide adenylyltransferase n=1 Tax=Cladobotryum mycophilum TaxID=491253 RepID=A0ABR0SA17_9HYPO